MAAAQEPTPETVKEFVIAAHGDFPKTQQLLAQYPALIKANAPWQETGIQAAAHTAQREIAHLLLDHGATLDICTAALLGMQAQVASLIEADPSLKDAKGAHGLPLLFYPAIGGEKAIAEFLLSNGADINAGAGGNTALHGAILFHQTEMAAWLLDHGASVDVLDFNGKTPLALALEKGFDDLADLLRERGAAN